jgi:hypothetical protein
VRYDIRVRRGASEQYSHPPLNAIPRAANSTTTTLPSHTVGHSCLYKRVTAMYVEVGDGS